jgi:hypothetical protein
VLYYDAWIPDLDLFSPFIHGFDIYTLDGMSQVIQEICGLQAQTCVGPNTVYDGVDDCMRTLAAKPFGRSDETWGDNVVCRIVHVLLTKIRPEAGFTFEHPEFFRSDFRQVHCPHVGPTGGGKCIDVEYNDVRCSPGSPRAKLKIHSFKGLFQR